jgi:DnaJ-domain-containing protein 1
MSVNKNREVNIKAKMLRSGRLVGGIAWRWLKVQPPIKRRLNALELKVDQIRNQVEEVIQIAEDEFWTWVRQLESEMPPRRSNAGPPLRECYALLGVAPSSEFSQVRKAWREAMRRCHPDLFAHDLEAQKHAEIKARAVNEAFQKIKASRGQ